MSETSLTREETNALRQSLGLPPLADHSIQSSSRQANDSQMQQHSEHNDGDDRSSVFQLRAKLEQRKAQRQSNRLLNGPTLSETLMFQTAGSAAKWIERQKQHVVSQSAVGSTSTDNQTSKDTQSAYDSAALQGLKVRHSFDDFDALEGDHNEIVLTLADRNILDDDESGDVVDELENAQLARHSDQINHKPNLATSSALDSTASDVKGSEFVLGISGVYQKSEEEQRRAAHLNELIQERAAFGLDDSDLRPSQGGQHYDLNQQTQVLESDYKPVKFNKKRKLVSLTSSNEYSMPTSGMADTASDRRSRLTSGGTSKEELLRVEEQRRKQAGFLNALENSNRSTAKRVEQDLIKKKGAHASFLADYDEEDAATARVFTQLKRPINNSQNRGSHLDLSSVVKQRSHLSSNIIGNHASSIMKQESKDSFSMSEEGAPLVVLSKTSAFVSGLSTDNDRDDARADRKANNSGIDPPTLPKIKRERHDEEEEEGQLTDHSADDDSEEEGVFDDEPVAGESVAAALALFKRRAHLDPHVAKRDKFDLVKYDALGNPMSKKEQFRELSHQFHGQGAGLTKRDKRLKAVRREQQQTKREQKQISTGQDRDTKIQKLMEKSQTPFIVLDKAKVKPV